MRGAVASPSSVTKTSPSLIPGFASYAWSAMNLMQIRPDAGPWLKKPGEIASESPSGVSRHHSTSPISREPGDAVT